MEKGVVLPKYLHQLIVSGEGEMLDFKFAIHEPRKIAITLSAFANTHGGKLLIGIRDNGTVAGAQVEEEAYMVDAAASLYCRPAVSFSTQTWKAAGKYVLEVTIDKALNRPVMAEIEESVWRAFIRRADENFPAPGVYLHYWRMAMTPKEEYYAHTEREKRVFELLSSGKTFSVSQLSRACSMHPAEMSQLLAKFMRWDLIDLDFDNGIARYCVK
jgi:hypothetical protein